MPNAKNEMKTITVFTILPFLLFSLVATGQTYKLTEFVETNLPEVSSPNWYNLNHSKHEFEVKNVNGSPQIFRAKDTPKYELSIKGGTLIGTDNGEWGGELIYRPNNTPEKVTKIKEGNINSIFHFNNKIYFIEGLAHGVISEGALFELEFSNKKFKYRKVLEFEDAPEAVAFDKDIILIAAHSNFYIIQDLKKELVLKDTFWNSLYPNSIAVLDDKNVYLGIRGGIVKLDLVTRTLKFFKYNQ
ncbi:hypothetical protein [Pontibacter arcticus]|uniref:Uncharacterized protein n=1 Tax=Pontibacter arcticus TaxID=2080288 RepID=A0A364RFX1_9BACT|nr:hypothetical protein [Pontibacter arcticus]RAU83155.1 hypothetical protein DP923_07970 [Pontibacter arcticus]